MQQDFHEKEINKEEDDFKHIFKNVFKKNGHLESKPSCSEYYFFESLTYGNTDNTINELTYNNFKSTNKIETTKTVKETDIIDTTEKNKEVSIINPEEKKIEPESNIPNIPNIPNNSLNDLFQEPNIFEQDLNQKFIKPYIKRKVWVRFPYKRKNIVLEKISTEDKCFPFTTGQGIITINEDRKININSTTFKIKRYFVDADGKRKKVKKQRKFKSDDIRKKIKVRFHKVFKDKINEYLKRAGSELLFSYFPQNFLTNTSKNFNSQFLDLTFEQLLSEDFTKYLSNYQSFRNDQKKYAINLEVLSYLEEFPEIAKNSGFSVVKNMKYKDLLSKYFLSKEFENSIVELKNDNESDDYINEYIFLAKNYINYFSNSSV